VREGEDMNDKTKYKKENREIEGAFEDEFSPMALSIDWDLYGSYLEGSDLSDEQKRELIETLWNIVVAFVDLGFGIHPVQQVCEQEAEIRDFAALIDGDMLNLENLSNDNLSEVTNGTPGTFRGRSPK
jgi:hypothetical protein